MALYQAASSWARACETCKISKSEQGDGFTIYVIEVSVPPFTWVVRHRYSDFFNLHEKLTASYHVDKSLLPPKKIFGSQSKSFVQQRQADLQLYLQTLIHQFGVLPSPLAHFLDFPKYEIRTITEDLSEMLFFQGDQILSSNDPFLMTPVQLHSLTERLKLAEPTCASGDKKCDLGHLLDFVSQLQILHITGRNEPLGNSNIVPNNLAFDLLPFKSLKILQIEGCELQRRLLKLDPLHETLTTLSVHNSLRDIETILLCGIIHWNPTDASNSWPQWLSVTTADLSHNLISKIHPAIRLIPSVSHLNLANNCIREVENLESLPCLEVLDLSHNKISHVEPLHTRLGNIKILHINNNSIKFLQGFSRLYSLVELDISNNSIASLDEVSHLGGLPCLEKLNLEFNPVTTITDYRPRVLLVFCSRATELNLDGKIGSQKELDTVAVLQALQAAKEGRSLRQGTDRVIPGRKMESGNTTSNPGISHSVSQCIIIGEAN